MSQPPDQIEKYREDWFKVHLSHEIRMLSESHRILDWTQPTLVGLLQSMVIDSFGLHARVLLEFFIKEAGIDGRKESVAFTAGFGVHSIQESRRYLQILNTEMAHLRFERQTDSNLRLNRDSRRKIADLLRKDLAAFKQCLKPEWTKYPLPEIEDHTGKPRRPLAIGVLQANGDYSFSDNYRPGQPKPFIANCIAYDIQADTSDNTAANLRDGRDMRLIDPDKEPPG